MGLPVKVLNVEFDSEEIIELSKYLSDTYIHYENKHALNAVRKLAHLAGMLEDLEKLDA